MTAKEIFLNHVRRQSVLPRAWQAARKRLASEFSRTTFERYIRTIEPGALDGHAVSLIVPDLFAKLWLERYTSKVQSALESALGFSVDVTFVVAKEAALDTDEQEVIQSPKYVRSGQQELYLLTDSDLPKRRPLVPAPTAPDRPDWIASFPLQQECTFETFVSDPGSRVALESCQSVALDPGARYNPLVIYGRSGTGKTHLLQAIAHDIRERYPNLNVGYVDGEHFTYHYVSADVERRTREFLSYCDLVDVWLVDDVQFLVSTEQTREEFNHIFKTLAATGRQVVVTSDHPPSEMSALGERLQSRLEEGIVVGISPPELETRMTIIERRCTRDGLNIPAEVRYFIATGIRNNLRTINGAVTKLAFYCDAEKVSASVDVAQEVLSEYMIDAPISGWSVKSVSMEAIIKAAAQQWGLEAQVLRSSRKDKKAVLARRAAMYLCRQLTPFGLSQIGDALGGRDHGTVQRGVAVIEVELQYDRELQAAIQVVREMLER
jgi:chromosomal replication initiator protein